LKGADDQVRAVEQFLGRFVNDQYVLAGNEAVLFGEFRLVAHVDMGCCHLGHLVADDAHLRAVGLGEFAGLQCGDHLGHLLGAILQLAMVLVHVQREISWGNGNENEHDEAHALLSIVRSMGETHSSASKDQNATDPRWWRLALLGFFEYALVLYKALEREHEKHSESETEQRRYHQR